MSDVQKDGRDENPEANDEGANLDSESGDVHDDVTMPPEAVRTSVESSSVHDDATLPPKSGIEPTDDTVDMPTSGDGSAKAATDSKTRVRYFGDYELLEEIARGGMGVVYKARQVNLNRVVALKMILTGQLASEEDVQRFYTEAEAAAKLEHPGIVPIFEIGEHAGQHFFSMGFIDGESLADRVKEGPLPPREAASITRQVAEAIAFAHENNVIHRDLKPANVLIDRNGQAKVTDFGLAKQTDGGAELTGTGQILGTPGYMPPEQAAGDTKRIGPAADIYSLGAILYALLTGRAPFQSASVMDTLIQVLEQQPVPVRLLNPKIDSDLETICLKCLEKDPEHRYSSAMALTDDLSRYLDGESISVKSLNLVDRLVRTLQRGKQDAELRTWGTMLFWFAAIVLLAEIGIFLHALDGPPYPRHWAVAIRASQYLAMGIVLGSYRKNWSVSTGAAERQMFSIWIGFFVACHLVICVAHLLATTEHPLDELRVYPFLAIISGLAFFVMGSSYWGHCYTFAVAFFALALLMPLTLLWAPLGFGLLWSVSLILIGIRLRCLSASTS